MDTLKDAARYRHFLEETRWDVVIIDEAHNVAGASSPEANKSYKLARLLSKRCENLLLTTATPHNGKPETFGRLISLLDPAIISDPELKSYRAEELEGYFLMRFKEDVIAELGEHLPERKLIPRAKTSREASSAEDAVYSHLADLREKAKSGVFGKKNALVAYGLYKLFLSSPEACRATAKKRLSGTKALDLAEQSSLETLVQLLSGLSIENSSRFGCLIKQLEELGWTGGADSPRVVVFTEYRETQEALFAAVTKHFNLKKCSSKHEAQAGQPVAMIHGGFHDENLKAVIQSFATGTSEIRMLIATDVASEGINLHHHCHQLIHYDLPWSIITLVQRTGRIDRYGQKTSPEIRYLMVKSADERFNGDDTIFEKLIEKADAINKTRRSGESVLQLYDAKLEEEFVATRGIVPSNIAVLEEAGPDYEAFNLDALLDQVRLSLVSSDVENPPVEVPKYEAKSENFSRLRILDDVDFFERGYSLLAEGDASYKPLQSTNALKILTAPADLRVYLGSPDQREVLFGATAIPEEAYPEDHEFHLSFDRKRIDLAIRAATNQRGHWSQETLLTDQHPIMLWVTERLLMQFPRGEVPYVSSTTLAEGEICYLFVGQVSSKSGLPLVVEPHAVSCRKGGAWKVEHLSDTLERIGFSSLVNDGRASKTAVAQSFLPLAVERSMIHLKDIAARKNEGLRPDLARIQRRIRNWKRGREECLEAKLSRLPPVHPERKRLSTDLAELESMAGAATETLSANYLLSNDPTTRPVLVIEGVR
jgi:superfamily II DNA or RNA helicase